MADALVRFVGTVTDGERRAYVARVCGRLAADGLWVGWIEFEDSVAGSTLRTSVETEQPNFADLEYWASGLTAAYLEGALVRARGAESAAIPAGDLPAIRAQDGRASVRSAPAAQAPHRPRLRSRAVLDPFQVYLQGEDVLRQELGALNEGHLRNIIRAHDLAEVEVDSGAMDRRTLAETIVLAVRRRME